jgi:polyisoprenoid-binding protein YceI
MRSLLATLLVATVLPAAAAPERFTIDPRHTYPLYEVQHMGISLQRGRFVKTQGTVTLDTESGRGSLEVSIDAASVDSADKKLDEHLRGNDFFKAEKNPKIVFRSSDFAFEGETLRRVSGELSMAGVTHPATLEAAFFRCGTHPILKRKICGGDFTARVKRSDWGMTYGIPSVADDVVLRINVEAIKDE